MAYLKNEDGLKKRRSKKIKKTLKKGRLPQNWRQPQNIMGVMDPVPKQSFQTLIPLKVANASLALQIVTITAWIQKKFWVKNKFGSKKT